MASTVAVTTEPHPEAAGYRTLALAACTHLCEHLYVGVITIILPVIAAAMGLSLAQVGLLVSVRSLGGGVLNLPSGFLADVWGRRKALLSTALLLIGLGFLFMSFAGGYWQLMLFMTLGSLGVGMYHPQAMSILSDTYKTRRGFALGFHDTGGNTGEIMAPLATGLLLTTLSWQGTLRVWAVLPLAMAVAFFALARTSEQRRLSRGDIGRLFRSGVLRNAQIRHMVALSVLRTMAQTAFVAFLPLYLTNQLHMGIGLVGFYLSVLFFAGSVSPSFAGWISDRMGRLPCLLAGLFITAVCIFMLPALPPGLALGTGLIVLGVAMYALRPVIFATAMESAPPEVGATIVGVLFTGNMGFSFLSPLIAGLLGDRFGLSLSLASIGVFPLAAAGVVTWHLLRGEAATPLRSAEAKPHAP
ncbi:MAG: MFS transporter [Deltaproteobacteria bacterium]|nr:MFS transporter [Deltaproteobacteria bacterium]